MLAVRGLTVLWLGMFSFVPIWNFVDNPKTSLRLFLDAFLLYSQILEWRVRDLVLGALLPIIVITLAMEISLAARHMIQVNSGPA